VNPPAKLPRKRVSAISQGCRQTPRGHASSTKLNTTAQRVAATACARSLQPGIARESNNRAVAQEENWNVRRTCPEKRAGGSVSERRGIIGKV